MYECPFQVGDIIIGNDRATYSITQPGKRVRVKKIKFTTSDEGEDDIIVEPVAGEIYSSCNWRKFVVSSYRFDLYEPAFRPTYDVSLVELLESNEEKHKSKIS